jgi:uncharacterized protein YjbJ (UPF0337 family)
MVTRLTDSHREGEYEMKPSTEDTTKSKIHEVKGTIKQTVGVLTDDPNLEVDGRAERDAGKVQHIVGKVEKVLGQ